jgi:hypothetical protein
MNILLYHRKFTEKHRYSCGDSKTQVLIMARVNSSDNIIYLDSGYTHHITTQKLILFDLKDTLLLLETSKANDGITLSGYGEMKFELDCNVVTINDVYYSENS